MKNMNIETKVRRAFEHAAPNVLDSVLSDCREQKGTVIKMKERKVNWTKRIVAAAAAVALIIGLGAGVGFYRINRAVAATVSLDVNPSVELTVNHKDRVLSVNANNEDGMKILGDMDLTGSALDVAVNALVGSMLRNGYLNEFANSVLVSVDSPDTAVGTALQEKLTREISALLEDDSFSGAIISQTVEKTDELSNQAQEHHISLGKANLIQQIISQDNRYTFDALADLSINELKLISESSSIELEHASSVGTASEKEYIGRDAALQAALGSINASAYEIYDQEVEMDYENGRMVYEVEFTWKQVEYDIEVDAKTGVCLTKDQDSYDVPENNADTNPADQGIGSAKAKEIAFNHAGVIAATARTVKCELDFDNGLAYYDVEFEADGYEYDYEIAAFSGEILNSEREQDDAAVNTTPKATESAVQTATDADPWIGKEKAQEIALEHAGVKASAAKNLKCELDRDDGTAHYHVEFDANGYEYDYEINATTGKVLKSEKERDDDYPVKATETASTELIGQDKAKKIALDHAGVASGDVREMECELDRDQGGPVYEVEFSSGGYEYSYEINAATGKIISSEKERD